MDRSQKNIQHDLLNPMDQFYPKDLNNTSLQSIDSIPVKLGSYMAERQAIRGRQVFSKIKSSQFQSKLEAAGMEIQHKKSNIMKLILRLIDELNKRKDMLQNRFMEELYEQERVFEGMLQMVSISGRQKRAKQQDQIRKRINNKKQQKNVILTALVSPTNIPKIKPSRFKFQQLVIRVSNFDQDNQKQKQNILVHSKTTRQMKYEKNVEDSSTRKTSNIIQNDSINNIVGDQVLSQKFRSPKISHLSLKLESQLAL